MKQLITILLVLITLSVQAQVPSWKPNPKYIATKKVNKVPSHQCMGTTTKGLRCRNKIADPKQTMCRVHQNQK